MEPVLRVGKGFFPLDKELELDGSDLTPHAQEGLVRLATWVPFGQATKLMEALLGVQVSKASVRRFTLQAGEALCGEWEQEAEEIQKHQPEAPAGAQKQVMSADGAMVPLVGGVWAEAKTLVVGAVTTSKTGEARVENLSYCSRLTDVPGFEQATLVETHRRGLEQATEVAAVMDGADWLQGTIDYHRADAVRILDFAHAAEYVSAIGEAVRQSGYTLPKNWLQAILHRLKHEGPQRVLTHLSHLCQRCTDPKVGKYLQYLSTRTSQMQYPTYQAAGWPIGSGIVESANKLVVEARLKGSGMHWKRENVNSMLILRNTACNDRWGEEWQVRMKHQQQQQKRKREEQTQERMQQTGAQFLLLLLRCGLSRPRPLEQATLPTVKEPTVTPPQASAGLRRPAATHPWRRFQLTRPTEAASARI